MGKLEEIAELAARLAGDAPPHRYKNVPIDTEASVPHLSPRAGKYRRIAAKIEDQYAHGNFDRAERWDERLERWNELADSRAEAMEDGIENASHGGVEDFDTGISNYAAHLYADMVAGRLDPASVARNLGDRAVVEGQLAGPARRQPHDSELVEFAREMYEARQALRARKMSPPPEGLRVLSLDDLIRRLESQ